MSFDVESLHHRRAVNRWERTSAGDVFERLTYSFPDKTALVGCPGAFGYPEYERITYREADVLANRIADALLARGLQRSDRVMLLCDNSVEAYVTKIAIAKAGLVAMAVNPMLAPDVMADLIERCEPALAIVDAELWPRGQEAFAATGLRPAVTIPIGGGPVEDSVGFDAFVAGRATTEPDVEIHGDDIWDILFTSGTTAMPKAVMLSHSYTHLAAYAHALTFAGGTRVEADAVLCNFFPMIFHIGGHIVPFPAFLMGGTMVIGRRFDPVLLAAALTDERATAVFAGAPPTINALLDVLESDRERYDIAAMGCFMYGWAQMSPESVTRLRALAGDVVTPCEIFGQTECIPNHRFWADTWPEKHATRAPRDNYVGVPSPLLASIVVDPAVGGTTPVEPGVPGEALYRSPAMTAGYYRDLDATREAFRDGWFHSGDSCVYDDDGLRIMVDRYKDIVKTGGENVSSLRVESVIGQHPGVQKAAVVGLPHERWGDAVTAFVIRAEGADLDADDVTAFVRERLATYERPKRIVFVDALPETVGGKVLKYKLRVEHAGLYDGAGS